MSLIAELKRRNVFKVAVAYLALGWIVVQVTSTVAPMFNLPAWLAPVVTWIGVAGFPFALLFAWIYELTPEGLKRESDVDRSASITHVTGRRLDYAIIALLVLAIGLFAFDRYGAHPRDAAPAATTAAPGNATAPASSGTSSQQSIAVLPFVNMSSDKEQEYFADGLSEELLNLLAQVPQLRVIARTSSFSFKGKNADVATIAKALGVGNVLEGSVRKAGDTLRITAQLIRAADSSHLWSQTFDRQATDVFKVQDEIAGAVVAALKLQLLPTQQLTNEHRSDNPEAYNQFLLGNQYFNRTTPEDFGRAVTAYRQAVALDPRYAVAYARLASAEMLAADYAATAAELNAGRQRAAQDAEKAIALAPELADGYASRGYLRLNWNWDWAGAQADLEKALALDRANTRAQRVYASLLGTQGRFPEAIDLAHGLIESDPLSAHVWTDLGNYLASIGDLAQARAAFDRAVAITPESSFANYSLGTLELLEGHGQQALAVFGRAGEVWRQAGAAMAQHTLGHRAESQQALDELIEQYAHDAAYQVAEVYAWRGETDRAFEWLDRAYTQRDGGMSYIKGDPLLMSLRKDQRYSALLARLRLPP